MKKSFILASISLLFVMTGCGTPSSQDMSSVPANNNLVTKEISTMQWKEISHENFWDQKVGKDYAFPKIAFSQPENWSFSCCGDRDDGSLHTLFSVDQDKTKPYITLYHAGLSGCPSDKPQCSIEETKKYTAQEKLSTWSMTLGKRPNGTRTIVQLPKLETTGISYQGNFHNDGAGLDEKDMTSVAFVVDNALLEISFAHISKLPTTIIEEFVGKITKE